MIILGIDPGPEDGMTAWAALQTDPARVAASRTAGTNAVLRDMVDTVPPFYSPAAIIVERLDSYLMRVGREVFSAQWAAGRLYQAAGDRGRYLTRQQVKRTLLGTVTGNDADTRAYLIDRFGPGRRAAVGLKASPGPLYGVKKDEWQALAVAVAWWDLNQATEEEREN